MNTNFGNKQLSADDRLAFKFADESYKAPDERKDIGDFEYDKEMSNIDTAVYHNHKTKQTRIGNRGSISKTDWLQTDLTGIAPGRENSDKRHQRVLKQTVDAHEKYGYDVMSHGHSMGASASNYATEKLGDNDWMLGNIGFNPGVSQAGRANYFSKTRRACRSKNPPKYCSKTTNIYEKGDYVSNQNALCGYLTFGLGPRALCGKSVGYGTGKFYDHRKPSRWYMKPFSRTLPVRMFSNGTQHSLKSFHVDE